MKFPKQVVTSTVKMMSLGSLVVLLLRIEPQESIFFGKHETVIPQITKVLAYSNIKENNDDNEGGKGVQTYGGSRGSCVESASPPLTALSPNSNAGITIASNPTFWFHVPTILVRNSGREIVGEFGLVLSNGELLFNPIEIDFPDQSGYISVTVPPNVALEKDIDYQWYFEFDCEDESPIISVYGWIKRVSVASESIAQTFSSEQDAYNFYIRNELWFDAINYVSSQRLENPTDEQLMERWFDILSNPEIELDWLPPNPILGAYQPYMPQ